MRLHFGDTPILEYFSVSLDKVFNFEITFPNPFPNEYGLKTSRGIASYRSIQALFQAWRIKSIVKDSTAHVIEIGAGLGRTAFYAIKLGIHKYTIVDIPFTSISSSYFLGCTLGEHNLRLHGEECQQKLVNFMTPNEFLDSKKPADLIANFDSFTEIDKKIAHAYWEHIFLCAPKFLSVNHEANDFRVLDFYLRSPIYNAIRTPYWMRRGYVEEIISIA